MAEDDDGTDEFMEWLNEIVPDEKELKCDLCNEDVKVPFDWKLVTMCNVCFGRMRARYIKQFGYKDLMDKYKDIGLCPKHNGKCVCE